MTVTIAAEGTDSIPVAPVNALGLPPANRLNPNFAEAFSNRGTAYDDKSQPDAFEWRATIMQSMTDAERREGWRLLARWRKSHGSKNIGADAGK